MSNSRNTFSGWIKNRRKRTGYWKAALKLRVARDIDKLLNGREMSRADLAREVGHTRSYITQVLQGEKNLTIDSMCDFAAVFGLVPKICFVHPNFFWSANYHVDTVFKAAVPVTEPPVGFQQTDTGIVVGIGDWFSENFAEDDSCQMEKIG